MSWNCDITKKILILQGMALSIMQKVANTSQSSNTIIAWMHEWRNVKHALIGTYVRIYICMRVRVRVCARVRIKRIWPSPCCDHRREKFRSTYKVRLIQLYNKFLFHGMVGFFWLFVLQVENALLSLL